MEHPTPDGALPKPSSCEAQVLVAGQAITVDSRQLSRFGALHSFQQETHAGSTFLLPDFITRDTFNALLDCPAGALGAGAQWLHAHACSMGAIARAAEFVGYEEVTELACGMLLLRMRLALQHAFGGGGDIAADADKVLAAAVDSVQQQPSAPPQEEDLRLLFPPPEPDHQWLSRVVRVPPEHFMQLVDVLVRADMVPAAGVLPGLTRALIWPALRATRQMPSFQVHGKWGACDSKPCLTLDVPASVLHSFDVCALEVNVTSHDQGWGGDARDHNTYKGSWTYFTLQVDERQIGDRLCTNLTAVSKWQQHTRVFGIGSQPLAALQAAAAGAADEEGGSSVTLVAHACFPGWCNHVSDAQIECFLAPRLKAS